MEDTGADAKERIMNTVVGLMLEQKDISKFPNREIARLAKVNSALINYYYQSRENLLNQAVAAAMSRMAGQALDRGAATGTPRERLRSFLKEISAFAVEHRVLSEISITGEMKSGNENTVSAILPLLREIYGNEKSELALKLLAMQIIIPLQAMLLSPAVYGKQLGVSLSDPTAGFELLDVIIDNCIGKEN